MKRIFTLSIMAIMMLSAMVVTSCSTAKSVNSSFVRNGYTMEALTMQQQESLAPVMKAFPSFNQTALGFLQTGNATTFVYQVDESIWNAYCGSLEAAGFSNLGTGYVKADKSVGVTYNISGKFTTIYKQTFLLVTYTWSNF
ncbi:MAG: hypothetical protein IJF46_00070 [Bacteroidaceae bacterium]|nr:hypothetical protein [Bacteroidaceae bacterium]MBR3855551.1 hypothetical protein [Bacteroidaceae bacterium]